MVEGMMSDSDEEENENVDERGQSEDDAGNSVSMSPSKKVY